MTTFCAIYSNKSDMHSKCTFDDLWGFNSRGDLEPVTIKNLKKLAANGSLRRVHENKVIDYVNVVFHSDEEKKVESYLNSSKRLPKPKRHSITAAGAKIPSRPSQKRSKMKSEKNNTSHKRKSLTKAKVQMKADEAIAADMVLEKRSMECKNGSKSEKSFNHCQSENDVAKQKKRKKIVKGGKSLASNGKFIDSDEKDASDKNCNDSEYSIITDTEPPKKKRKNTGLHAQSTALQESDAGEDEEKEKFPGGSPVLPDKSVAEVPFGFHVSSPKSSDNEGTPSVKRNTQKSGSCHTEDNGSLSQTSSESPPIVPVIRRTKRTFSVIDDASDSNIDSEEERYASKLKSYFTRKPLKTLRHERTQNKNEKRDSHNDSENDTRVNDFKNKNNKNDGTFFTRRPGVLIRPGDKNTMDDTIIPPQAPTISESRQEDRESADDVDRSISESREEDKESEDDVDRNPSPVVQSPPKNKHGKPLVYMNSIIAKLRAELLELKNIKDENQKLQEEIQQLEKEKGELEDKVKKLEEALEEGRVPIETSSIIIKDSVENAIKRQEEYSGPKIIPGTTKLKILPDFDMLATDWNILVNKETMRLRVDCLLPHIWSREQWLHYYRNPPAHDPEAQKFPPEDLIKFKDILDLLQKARIRDGLADENWATEYENWINGKVKSDRYRYYKAHPELAIQKRIVSKEGDGHSLERRAISKSNKLKSKSRKNKSKQAI